MSGIGSTPFKSVVVYLEFDRQLQTLTGVSRTPVEVTEGTPFFMLLQAVLDSYPSIILTHDLSSLGFSINGTRPNPRATLSAHDVITLGVQDASNGPDGLDDEYYH